MSEGSKSTAPAQSETALALQREARELRQQTAFGVRPTNLDEAFRLASYLAKSDLVPKEFRDKPENVLVASQLGAELGLAMMQSLQSIAVINGRPSIWGDGFLALLLASPVYEEHEEYFEVDGKEIEGDPDAEQLKKLTTRAVCVFKRKGAKRAVKRTFSVADANKAGLWGKSGPWTNYPSRMLRMRARGFAGRDTFPDVLRGLAIAEEAQDIPAPTAETIEMPRRASEVVGAPATGRAPEPLTAAAGKVVESALEAAAERKVERPTPTTDADLDEMGLRADEPVDEPRNAVQGDARNQPSDLRSHAGDGAGAAAEAGAGPTDEELERELDAQAAAESGDAEPVVLISDVQRRGLLQALKQHGKTAGDLAKFLNTELKITSTRELSTRDLPKVEAWIGK